MCELGIYALKVCDESKLSKTCEQDIDSGHRAIRRALETTRVRLLLLQKVSCKASDFRVVRH